MAFRREDVEQSLPQRFEEEVRRHGARLAIDYRGGRLSYAELNRAANRLAHAIVARDGARGGPVALLLARGVWEAGAILGVLKTGRVYVPLDPALPPARLAEILNDAEAELVVADGRSLGRLREVVPRACGVIDVEQLEGSLPDTDLRLAIDPGAPAYVLYTSGSTGQPKGVVQSHRNVLHNVMKYTNGAHLSADDRLSLLPSYGFGASVSDVFGALLNGASLHPFDLRCDGLVALAAWLGEQEITVYHSVPTLFRQLCQSLDGHERFPQVRLVKLGGEPLYRSDVELYRRHFPSTCTLYNGLGATECNIIRQYFLDHTTEVAGDVVPVGYAVDDTCVLVLDETGAEVPAGSVGEIAIRSRYLAAGYWRRPELTARSFVAVPGREGERLYRTGDLGRLRADGCLEHLGRVDHQVKIRGFRVEPAEIEAVLLQHPEVRQAVVSAHEAEPGSRRLVAYVVATDPQHVPTGAGLRAFLRDRLPEYMVPAAFAALDALPLTATGKVDRGRLPAPAPAARDLEAPAVAPRDDRERRLLRAWEETLGIRGIGVTDNFFQLGGHSLSAARLCARLERELGRTVGLSTFFLAPTVEGLALALREDASRARRTSLVALRARGSRPPFFCVPIGQGSVHVELGDIAQQLGAEQPFYGVQALVEHPSEVEARAKLFVEEIQSVQPEGPYLLGGICQGGVVAFEMARQLVARGAKVPLVVMVEPPWPLAPTRQARLGFAVTTAARAVRTAHHYVGSVLGGRSSYARLVTKAAANLWAFRRYVPRRYPGDIVLFLAEASLTESRGFARVDWRGLADGVRTELLPGGRATITRAAGLVPDESQLRAMGALLTKCIDEALRA